MLFPTLNEYYYTSFTKVTILIRYCNVSYNMFYKLCISKKKKKKKIVQQF